MSQQPNPNRMSIFNSFELGEPENGWATWKPKGEQLIVCLCGFTDGFRVFADGDIAKTLDNHNKVCPLLEGRDRSKV